MLPSPNAVKFTPLEKAILEVLCYFGVFSFPVSLYKIAAYLPLVDASVSIRDIDSALNRLVQHGYVIRHRTHYYLATVKPVLLEKRSQQSVTALDIANYAASYIKKIPWIRLIAVTGSVAAYNKTEKDDIDIFIITQKNRLWISRFFVFLILNSLNLYRTEKASQNKLCTNLFVDESNAVWQDKSQYVAHEVASMLPLYNKKDAYFTFLSANFWIQQFYPNFKFYSFSSKEKQTETNVLMNLWETFFRNIQLFYMSSKKTTETVSNSVAHFNKSDSKNKILSEFSKLKTLYRLD